MLDGKVKNITSANTNDTKLIWQGWFNKEDSFFITKSERNTDSDKNTVDVTLQHIDFEGQVLNEYQKEDIIFGINNLKFSPSSNEVVASVNEESLMIWNLDDDSIIEVNYLRGFPLRWINNNTILVHVGSKGTGGDYPHSIAYLNFTSESVEIIDENKKDFQPFYRIHSISSDNKKLIASINTEDGNLPFLLDIEDKKRNYLDGVEGRLREALFYKDKFYLLIKSENSSDKYESIGLYKIDESSKLIKIKNFETKERFNPLTIVDGKLHYLEKYNDKMHWKTIDISN